MESKLLLDDGEITRTLERLAYQILEKHEKCENIMLVGIERRGADLARRLQKILSSTVNHEVALGTLDINLYRDDWTSMDASPRVGQSNIPQDVTGVAVILIDDVLYTGRTIRSALEAILDSAGPAPLSFWFSLTAGTASFPSRPTTLAAPSIRPGKSTWMSCLKNATARTKCAFPATDPWQKPFCLCRQHYCGRLFLYPLV